MNANLRAQPPASASLEQLEEQRGCTPSLAALVDPGWGGNSTHPSTYQYRVKTTYITTFFFFLLLCFPEHCFCCLCLLFYPILYSFLFYSLLACVVILSRCVSFFLLSFCLNVERIVKLNLFQPILKKRQGKG